MNVKEKEDKLVKAPPTAIEQVPDYVTQGAVGTEEVEREDLTLPRIGLAQSQSPQRKKTDARYIPGLDEGQLFNTVTRQIYGEKVQLIPLFFFKQQMKFKDIEEGGGIECISVNGKNGGALHPSDCKTCPHNQFKEGKPPACDKIMNYASLLGDGGVAVLSLKSTQINKGREFNAKVRMSNRPMFSRVVEVKAVIESKHNQQYYGVQLEPQGWVPKEIYDRAMQLFAELHDRGVQVDTTGLDAEGKDEDTEFATGRM